jgi:hypothetical protein
VDLREEGTAPGGNHRSDRHRGRARLRRPNEGSDQERSRV